jgi:endonuclease/exonuclease/phosphatase (EEP) superfamily protein YafD
LTVLAANVWLGRADTAALAAVLDRERPDFVVISEAAWDYHDKLMPMIAHLEYRAWVSLQRGEPDALGVTVLSAPSAGDVTPASGPESCHRHLRLSGGVLGERVLVAAHLAAPRSRAEARKWRSELNEVARWTRMPLTPIVAGDFNATLDHSLLQAVLGPCRSAAELHGKGLLATYPAQLPRWAGIHIDHVLVPAGTRVTDCAVIDLPGSDHRGVLARFQLPAAPPVRSGVP